MVAVLLASPMHSVTVPAPVAFTLYSHTCTFVALAVRRHAAMLRFALATGELDDEASRPDMAGESGDAFPAPLGRPWIRGGLLQRLLRARQDARALPSQISETKHTPAART